jgi:hypothetical protein
MKFLGMQYYLVSSEFIPPQLNYTKLNSVAWARERTIPTERPALFS